MIEIITADITKLEVDAIVNAANCSLLGGGGGRDERCGTGNDCGRCSGEAYPPGMPPPGALLGGSGKPSISRKARLFL